MNDEQKKALIEAYLSAYNRFDVDEMITLAHPDIVFQNVSGNEVTAEAIGIENLRELAEGSKQLFSARCQQASNYRFEADKVTTDIAYEGTLAQDLPNGMKAGETLTLTGRSEFVISDRKFRRITDYS